MLALVTSYSIIVTTLVTVLVSQFYQITLRVPGQLNYLVVLRGICYVCPNMEISWRTIKVIENPFLIASYSLSCFIMIHNNAGTAQGPPEIVLKNAVIVSEHQH